MYLHLVSVQRFIVVFTPDPSKLVCKKLVQLVGSRVTTLDVTLDPTWTQIKLTNSIYEVVNMYNTIEGLE